LDDGLHSDDDPRVLRDPFTDSNSVIHGDRQTSDGESGDKSWTGEQSAQVSQTGGHDAGHGGAMFFPMLITFQGSHPLDHYRAAQDGCLAWNRRLL